MYNVQSVGKDNLAKQIVAPASSNFYSLSSLGNNPGLDSPHLRNAVTNLKNRGNRFFFFYQRIT